LTFAAVDGMHARCPEERIVIEQARRHKAVAVAAGESGELSLFFLLHSFQRGI